MKKLLMIVNEDRFFLSHRKDIALSAQKEGWDVKIVCKDTGQRKDVEALGLTMMLVVAVWSIVLPSLRRI